MRTETLKTFKQKDLILKRIGIDYRKESLLELGGYTIEEDETEYLEKCRDKKYYSNVKLKVDYILKQIDESLVAIIYNEYLTKTACNWWIYYYSKSTYYRMKNKAMDAFLEWWYA